MDGVNVFMAEATGVLIFSLQSQGSGSPLWLLTVAQSSGECVCLSVRRAACYVAIGPTSSLV